MDEQPILDTYFRNGDAVTILRCSFLHQNDFDSLLKEPDTFYIGKKTCLLPFLTIRDNLMIGLPKEKQAAALVEIKKLQHFFKLPNTVKSQHPEVLSPEQLFLIHLIRSLILENHLIIVNCVELKLTRFFISALQPALELLAEQHPFKLIFLVK